MSQQVPALAGICLLLFLEEAGLPLPVAPGEAILIGAGLLIASGSAPAWLAVPLCYVAVLAGALTGYTWAHRLGAVRLRALAGRLHAGRPYELASARLRSASALQIAGSRLLPGLRVYTSLVAGAVGLSMRRFLSGVVPASAVWVLVFTGLGFFVGVPVERLLGRFEAYTLRAVLVAVVVLLWFIAARRMPGPDARVPVPARLGGWRLALALGFDISAVCLVAAMLSIVAGLVRGDFDDAVFAAAIFAILGVLYLLVARRTVGFTLGEALLDVRYHPPRLPRLPAPG